MPAWQHKIEAFQVPGTAIDDKRGIAMARVKLAERLDQLSVGGWELAHYNAIDNGPDAPSYIFTIWKRPSP